MYMDSSASQSLIAPEIVVVWATSQFFSSRRAVTTLRQFSACSDWTLTHGMFLIMGGFMLTDPSGNHLGVLQDTDLEYLLPRKLVSFPRISSSEIMDRSKADALAKTLALVQTTWFMVQIISRAVQRLPITELELTTIAFAFLNVLRYAFWLQKPQNVRYPILVQLLQRSSDPVQNDRGEDTASLPNDPEDSNVGIVENGTSVIQRQPILAPYLQDNNPVQNDLNENTTFVWPDDPEETGLGTDESGASFIEQRPIFLQDNDPAEFILPPPSHI
ncbi:hypothetical protein BT96DRAFT_1101696 [Gymnopus androsaceus JB14]|uniref:Uncharacterized protein n=1 Tax=Gymnopus androsaceus JB14 TaxID=1447944 RepID=A0A6A4HMK1_9AGAR|nr:hypothetical protein BT96DRAFT_1101696 [Gymnopus androsaceus JB14]